jgi:hypothetical protein
VLIGLAASAGSQRRRRREATAGSPSGDSPMHARPPEPFTPNNADGSGLTQIIHPPAHTIDDQPDWAADGTRLVFCRLNRDRSCAITTVNADGTGLRQLTRPCDALPPRMVDRYSPSLVVADDGSTHALRRPPCMGRPLGRLLDVL